METRYVKEKEVKQMVLSRLDEMLKNNTDVCNAFRNTSAWCKRKNKSFNIFLQLEITTSCVTEVLGGKKIEEALDSIFTVERILKLIAFATRDILVSLAEVEDIPFLDENVDRIMNGKF